MPLDVPNPITARDIVSLALKEIGVLGVGQTALPEDINDGFTLLRRFLAQWQKRRWLVPSLIKITTVGNGLESNLIGPGQFWNAPRPSKISAGWITQLNTGSNPVSLPLSQIFSYQDYAKIQVKALNSLPQYFFYDGMFPYGNIRIWPIPSATYQINLLVQCAIGFNTSVNTGLIFSAGAAYTNGVYLAVDLTGGTGSGAKADITVAGGVITAVTITDGGTGYVINDSLSVLNTNVGGTGAGFSWTVQTLFGTLDNVLNMPPEYEEAIHYALALRLSTMYKKQLSKAQIMLGKAALNTIRVANTQIPTMGMPVGMSVGRSFNIFNPDN